jgi:hypothetical protein
MRTIIKYLGLTIILTIIGFVIRNYFFELSLSQIANNNVEIVSRNMSGQFESHIIFALTIGILPLFYLIIEKITKLVFIKNGLIACGILILSGILLWQYRIYQLNSEVQKISEYNIGNDFKTSLDYDNLNFSRFLFFGFLIGTIISILIFRNRNKNHAE